MDSAAHLPDVEARTATPPSGGSRPTDRGGGTVTPWGALTPQDVEKFLALVAHELRTPQAVIAAASDVLTSLLGDDELDRAQVERIADVIRRHSHLSARLVARLSLTHEIGQGRSGSRPSSWTSPAWSRRSSPTWQRSCSRSAR